MSLFPSSQHSSSLSLLLFLHLIPSFLRPFFLFPSSFLSPLSLSTFLFLSFSIHFLSTFSFSLCFFSFLFLQLSFFLCYLSLSIPFPQYSLCLYIIYNLSFFLAFSFLSFYFSSICLFEDEWSYVTIKKPLSCHIALYRVAHFKPTWPLIDDAAPSDAPGQNLCNQSSESYGKHSALYQHYNAMHRSLAHFSGLSRTYNKCMINEML